MIDGSRVDANLDNVKTQAMNNEYYAYDNNEYGAEETGVELTEIRIKKSKTKK